MAVTTEHEELSPIDECERRQVEILDADYTPPPLEDSIPSHLSHEQQRELLELLKSFSSNLFNGKVGLWAGEPYELPLKPDAKPYYSEPFPIARSQDAVTRREIARLEDLGVICKDVDSSWAAPTFVIPKRISLCAF